jgi:hypothetical protein
VAAHGVLLIIFVSAFGRSIWIALDRLHDGLVGQVPTAAMKVDGVRTHDTDSDNVAAMHWIAAVRKADPSPTPWRVMLWGRHQGHMHWFWAQGVDMGVPVVDYGWFSANFLNNRPRELSAEGFRTWNIRYLITNQGGQPFPELKRVHTQGSYSVWELDQYDDRFVVAPQHVKIKNLKLEGNDISFDVQGAEGGTDVQIRTAYYPRWSAEQNGKRVEVRPSAARPGKNHEDQLAVFVRDGRIRLSFGAPPPRFWPGLTLSLLGLLGMIVILKRRRRAWIASKLNASLSWARRSVARVRAWRWYRRMVLTGAVLLTLSLVALGVFAGSRRLIPSPIEGWGMKVQMKRYDRPLSNCDALIARGRYDCKSGDRRLVEVNAALGSTEVKDASGEWAKLWPSTRVHLMDDSTTAVISYSRVARFGSTLRLRTQSSGDVELVVVTGNFRSQPIKLEPAGQTHFVQVPRGLPATLSIELKPLRGDVWAHFWGAI